MIQPLPKPTKQPKKKTSFKKISLNKYDQLWARQIRERDGRCLYCSAMQNLQAHHLFRRGISATRYALDNGFTLCSSHHTFSFGFSAHRTEQTFKLWAKEYLGEERYNALEAKSRIIMSRSKAVAEFMNQLPQ